MNSLCIKTNNNDILNYLESEISNFNMLNTFYSKNKFKNYKNIIIHYTGKDKELFYTKLATIFSYLVIDYFESKIIKQILNSSYFYFEKDEITKILETCEDNLCDTGNFSFANRQLVLFNIFYEYITTHNSIILTGFINFRLQNYRKLIEETIDLSVKEFIIEREYLEFVSLLRLYINSQPASDTIIHIISFNNKILVLDENMQKIKISKDLLQAKYLSDISFSNNDYILNTLLTILPKKIHLHLISGSNNLDFLNTLQLIFENRLDICHNCNICNIYKTSNISKD